MNKTQKRVFLFVVVAVIVCSQTFATTLDVGISTYIDKVASIARGIAIPAAMLSLILLGIALIGKHSWDEKVKIALACILGGCIIVALAAGIVSALFGDSSAMGAVIPMEQIGLLK